MFNENFFLENDDEFLDDEYLDDDDYLDGSDIDDEAMYEYTYTNGEKSQVKNPSQTDRRKAIEFGHNGNKVSGMRKLSDDSSLIDIKDLGFRVSKRINNTLQRSNMNPLLKPYFTESSIQYKKDKDGKTYFMLNSESINNAEMLDEIPDRYGNNIKFLIETAQDILEKECLTNVFELQECSTENELMEFNDTYKNKYFQCALVLNEESIDYEQGGLEKATTSDDIPWEERNSRGLKLNINQSDYYKMFEDQGGSTTRELRAEVNFNSPRMVSNPMNVKYSKINNKSVANSENLYECVDFINNLSDEDKLSIFTLLESNGFITKK